MVSYGNLFRKMATDSPEEHFLLLLCSDTAEFEQQVEEVALS